MYAAGLTLKKENLQPFTQRFEEIVSSSIEEEMLIPKIDVDMEIDLSEITYSLLNKLDQMTPFGPGNMQPIFISRGVRLYSSSRLLKEKHLKFNVVQGKSSPLSCIGFNLGEKKDLIDNTEHFSIKPLNIRK